MQLISMCDNGEIHVPDTRGAEVLSAGLTNQKLLSNSDVMNQYPAVFIDGVGRLAGEYNIEIDSSVPPVQHAPRRVPVAFHQKLCDTLDQLQKDNGKILLKLLSLHLRSRPWLSCPRKMVVCVCVRPERFDQSCAT